MEHTIKLKPYLCFATEQALKQLAAKYASDKGWPVVIDNPYNASTQPPKVQPTG